MAHGHQGLTLGPTTARILADMTDGDAEDWTADLIPANRAIFS
ncbi:hypothetical protein [uncultured Cohaesibacter sp.]|nr:hypothetical protein [uncultured Cohaesibacter sp.]